MRQVAKKGLITVIATGGVLAVTGGYAYADAGAAGSAAGSPGVLSGNTVQVPVHVPVNVCGNTVDIIGALNPAFGNHCANTSNGVAGTTGGGATATGASSNSPGVGSGNTVQVPVHAPVNACGNSANVVGALNPTFGNGCANTSQGGAGTTAGGGSTATGGSSNSPGVGSGNTVQVPVHVPVNACGNSVDVVGLLNPVFGNGCDNGGTPVTPAPPTVPTPPVTPTPPTPVSTPPATPHVPSQPVAPGPRHARPAPAQQMLAHTGVQEMGLMAATGAGALLGGFVLYRRGRAMRG
ncbi:chaplin [Streptomyces sp. SL13]|uniref:Chaplin n=1 Tax=Streptantibioticus silvisoli TaxID=2705255 RepID=A0AA90HBJ6_9ACTN|nr:chaplin [Streptantibioticus silvisoli]MDI5974303.1 chaplin [Streptantibioticus silvisoli]